MMENREQLKEDVKKNVSDRILQIMAREGLKAGEFADSINVAQATLSQILRGRNMPSMDFLLRLRQRYPDISIDWLLTGNSRINDIDEGASSTVLSPEMDKEGYPLFAENAGNSTERTVFAENRKDFALKTAQNEHKDTVRQEIIYRERPPRKITEIRIFFDDNTYETFRPEKG